LRHEWTFGQNAGEETVRLTTFVTILFPSGKPSYTERNRVVQYHVKES